MNIVFLGSGNAATVLARLMYQKGHRILQVWSRNAAHAVQLANEVEAHAIDELAAIDSSADLCVLAVSDDAVREVASQLSLRKKILVHTAGSVAMDVLKGASPNYGVLYPLQSLRKEMSWIPEIPLLTDGNSDEVKVLLFDFAQTLSAHVKEAGDAERLHLHLAAVMVNNFTNHLYAVTEDFCSKHQLRFELLHPLIIETAQRIKMGSAFDLQTGPARRGDEQTLEKHVQLLAQSPPLQHLYETISKSILEMYYKKKELR